MDKLNAMQAFARVVEAGTFTKAADSLELPKAAVTRLIQSLEEHLEVKLLNRTTRRVTVTPDGAAYYERVSRLLGEIDELEGSISHARATPRGRLRIDVASSVARLLLIPALPEFHARYPDIQIDLGVSDRPVDLVGDNVDCVVRGGEITDQSLVARRVGAWRYACAAAPAYVREHGLPLHPRDLESGDHKIVSYFSSRTGRQFSFDFNRKGERVEVQGRYRLSVNDGTAYMTAGLAGLGVIQAPFFMLKPHVDAAELVPLMTDWESDPLPLYVVYPPNRHLSTKLRVFVDWVADLFARHTDAEEQLLAACCKARTANGEVDACLELESWYAQLDGEHQARKLARAQGKPLPHPQPATWLAKRGPIAQPSKLPGMAPVLQDGVATIEAEPLPQPPQALAA
ncbi:MAG TPA: LysR family transcriptional regulator [Ideonella sp.]|uniref:LysR substrate-binding domain-containing protein n=1 Tax=Ideonella sp. TaxID=1929293 RepID=UPI002CE56235|nr:LysR family transcriptional regulator [Ideonella sp.]HSI47848.1 LysR family transcriptional regulator [Ideonella sp.]